MIVHYQNRHGMKRFISNVIHFQNIGNETFEALMKNGTTLTLRVGRIEGIYGKDEDETTREEVNNTGGVDGVKLSIDQVRKFKKDFIELNGERETKGSTIMSLVETIEALQQENEQLKTSEKICEDCWNYALAQKEGRLIVLPCKVGTRVWVIGQDCDLCHDMYTEEPCLFGDCEYRKVIESVFLPGMTDEFGKTVFLTREAAEKALSTCNVTKLPCCEHRRG